MTAVSENSRLRGLSAEERAVLDATLEGDKNVKIANRIGVSLRTVERLRAAAIRKLGARSIVEAARLVTVEQAVAARPDPMSEVMATAFRNAPAPTLVVAFDGRIAAVNEAFGRLLGYDDASELVGRFCSDLTHPDDVAGDAAYCRVLSSGGSDLAPRRKRFVDRRGGAVPAILAVSIARDQGGTPVFCVAQAIPAA